MGSCMGCYSSANSTRAVLQCRHGSAQLLNLPLNFIDVLTCGNQPLRFYRDLILQVSDVRRQDLMRILQVLWMNWSGRQGWRSRSTCPCFVLVPAPPQARHSEAKGEASSHFPGCRGRENGSRCGCATNLVGDVLNEILVSRTKSNSQWAKMEYSTTSLCLGGIRGSNLTIGPLNSRGRDD